MKVNPQQVKKTMDALLDTVEWREVEIAMYADDDTMPYVTHEGVLDVGGMKLKVFQLSDGHRVIEAASMDRLLYGDQYVSPLQGGK